MPPLSVPGIGGRGKARYPRLAVPAPELPVAGVPTGALAVEAASDDGETNVLPCGPASTASPVALPFRYCDQGRNHGVQPSSHLPAAVLAVMVIGSPGMDNL